MGSNPTGLTLGDETKLLVKSEMLDRLTDQISDPVKFRRLNGWLVIFWLVMIPVAIITGLVNLLWFVTILSLYANFATHLGAWAASRAEVKADIGVANIEAKTASVEADEVSVHTPPSSNGPGQEAFNL